MLFQACFPDEFFGESGSTTSVFLPLIQESHYSRLRRPPQRTLRVLSVAIPWSRH